MEVGGNRRSGRSRFVPPDLPEFVDLCQSADEKLFRQVTANCDRVSFIHNLCPNRTLSHPSQASQR